MLTFYLRFISIFNDENNQLMVMLPYMYLLLEYY